MQTFLPYADFVKSAQVLDYRRLGKQRVEAKQILMTLLGQSRGWKTHPAVRMWTGYEEVLCMYGLTMCTQWVSRGYRDTLTAYFEAELAKLRKLGRTVLAPPWLGDKKFHRSHRSNLVRKDPVYYRKHFPRVPDNLPYVWPVNEWGH